MPPPGLLITTLKAQLNYIFEQMKEINTIVFSPEQLHNTFKEQTGEDLESKLAAINMTLQVFLTNHFFDDIITIPDQNQSTYMFRAIHQTLLSNKKHVLPPPSVETNEPSSPSLNVPSPKNDTPTSPPAAQRFESSNAFSPPGFPSANNPRLVEQREQTLQKHFSERGFEGVFHSEALKLHFGDLSELIHLDEEPSQQLENRSLFNGSSIFNGKSFINGRDLLNIENGQIGSSYNITECDGPECDPVEHTTPIVDPPDSETDDMNEGFSSLPDNEDFPPLSNTTPVISPPPGFENCNVPSSQTCDDNKSKKLDESEFPPPAWINDGTSTWKNVAEKPAWINDGTSTWKNVVEKPDDVPPTNSSNWVNDGTSTWKNVAKKFDENDFPPIGQPSINVVERPEEPKLPPNKIPRNEVKVTLDMTPLGLEPDHAKLFYAVFQGSIKNSLPVNAYRDEYINYLKTNSRLYANPDGGFRWLTGHRLYPNPNIVGYMPNNAFIIDVLQECAKMYPDGMSASDLVELENKLCSVDQRVCLGKSTSIMSITEIVNLQMIDFKDNRYYVNPDILSIDLWRLPEGITSNLFRVLNAQQDVSIEYIVGYNGILVEENGDMITLQDEDVVRQANMFPLVFKIQAQAIEQNSLRTGYISLHPELPRWKVLLDQPGFDPALPEYKEILTTTPFHCDCPKCYRGKGKEGLPVKVPPV